MPPRRNEPCPCDSGKRFKHCHGREFGPPPVPREIADSVRFVCFETHLEDFRYATNGGTAFIVRRKRTPFGITCRHVLRGFSIDDLVITDAGTGRKAAGIKGMYLPTNLRDENEGSDLDDICVIAFNEFEGQFFDGAYDLDRQPAVSSEPANQVIATGFLKQKGALIRRTFLQDWAFWNFAMPAWRNSTMPCAEDWQHTQTLISIVLRA